MVGSEPDGDCEFLILEFTTFFQQAKQDICTSGFCIQLNIYINIESLSDTEKEVRPASKSHCKLSRHPNLPIYLSDQIERIQKRAFRIMYATLRNEDALQTTRCTRLSIRRHHVCLKTFETIGSNKSKLAHLLPKKRQKCHGRCLRKSNNFNLFSCRTNRFKHSVFPFYTNVFNS